MGRGQVPLRPHQQFPWLVFLASSQTFAGLPAQLLWVVHSRSGTLSKQNVTDACPEPPRKPRPGWRLSRGKPTDKKAHRHLPCRHTLCPRHAAGTRVKVSWIRMRTYIQARLPTVALPWRAPGTHRLRPWSRVSRDAFVFPGTRMHAMPSVPNDRCFLI
jgi:hypothetical protein